VAYAVSYIQSDTAQRGVFLRIGSDDRAKLYLNGVLIYQPSVPRAGYWPDQDVVGGLELKSGINVLVLKVVNQTGDWKCGVRFTDAEGNSLKGISATLAP
jgi:hypothetical protein